MTDDVPDIQDLIGNEVDAIETTVKDISIVFRLEDGRRWKATWRATLRDDAESPNIVEAPRLEQMLRRDGDA